MKIKQNDIILIKLVNKKDKDDFIEELFIWDYYEDKNILDVIYKELREDLNTYFIKDISIYDKYDINNKEDITIKVYRSLIW